jgi:WD40 repeat protein/serine/threonine protein kinase
MPSLTSCPKPDEYYRLAVGQLPPAEVERLAQHLEQCASCAEAVQALHVEDAFLEDARAARLDAEGMPPGTLGSSVVERLCSLRPPDDPYRTAPPGETPPPQEAAGAYDFLAPPEAPGELGRLGPYRVLKVLGIGGMGIVFEAEDPQLQRRVALKVMKPALAASDSARQRFLREARAMAALSHDHIVTIHQVGEDRFMPFMAMQLLHGETLQQRLRREGRLPAAEAVRVGREIAAGLAAAHGRGLIHRDIKSANIFLEAGSGRVRILDFGLARPEHDSEHMTGPGDLVGTPAYMAPEQASTEAGPVGPWSDVYSLGVVLYHMLSGRLPFEGSVRQVIYQIGHETPPRPSHFRPDLDPGLEVIVDRAMARRREERYATACDLAAALEQWKTQEQPPGRAQAAPRSCPQTAAVPSRRHLLPWVAAAALFAFGGGILLPQVIRIINRDGTVEKEIPLKPGQRAEFIPDGKVLSEGKSALPPKPADGKVLPDPLAAIRAGEPLNPLALVIRPAEIAGLQSWTLETRAHRGIVHAVAFSPDGRWLASGDAAGTIRLWHPETGNLARALVGQVRSVTCLAWSPDGKLLAAGSSDEGVARLWQVESGSIVGTFHFRPAYRSYLAWSPDGSMLASIDGDTCVRVWEVSTRHELPTIASPDTVTVLAWAQDGNVLASTSQHSQNVNLWHLKTGKLLRTLKSPTIGSAPGWSAQGKPLAVYREGDNVRLWDLESNRPTPYAPVLGSNQSFSGRRHWIDWVFSPDGRVMATPGALYDAATGRRLRDLEGPSGLALPGELAWSPDSKTIVSGGTDGIVRLWDAASGTCTTLLPGCGPPISCKPTWSPDGRILAVGGTEATVRIWELDSDPPLKQSLEPPGTRGHVSALVLSPDLETLACDFGSGMLYLRNLKRGQDLRGRDSIGHAEGIIVMAWSADGKTLASGSLDKEVRLWEAASGKLLYTLRGHSQAVWDLAWSPDGRMLAAAGYMDVIRIWDPKSGKSLRTLQGSTTLAWSPDGKLLASGSKDRNVQLWDPVTGECIDTLLGHTPLAWLPDGKTLLAYGNNTVRFWDTASGQTLRVVKAMGEGPVSLARRQVAAWNEGVSAIRLWDIDSGRPCGILLPLRNGLVVSPDGHFRGSPGVDRDLVYVAQTERGQETLTPDEFARRYGWKNDSARVRLLP